MPGQRFRWQHGPHEVRILKASAHKELVHLENRQGIKYSAPLRELRPIPQKSTKPRRHRAGPTSRKAGKKASKHGSRTPQRKRR